MNAQTIIPAVGAAMMILAATGCENEDTRLARLAEQYGERQAEQSKQIIELHREVAEGSRQLVEADAKARQEIVGMHRDFQTERSEIGRQRDELEDDRRYFAAQRRSDPIIAAAIANVGLILACVLPLVLCWYLLHRRVEPADDQEVIEVLLEDLMIDQPRLLSAPDRWESGRGPDRNLPRLTNDPAPTDDSD